MVEVEMISCQVGWRAINIEPSHQISPCCLISPMHGASLATSSTSMTHSTGINPVSAHFAIGTSKLLKTIPVV